MFLKLALHSLLHRRLAAMLTVASIMISTFVVLGVEHIRQETRNSFSKTVSGTDLIVGARTSQVNLLLYSIFRIGNASANISWNSYQEIAAMPGIAWSIPLSLGDSHRGFRVLGTTADYFVHFRYGNNQSLALLEGRVFNENPDGYLAILGAEAAERLGYSTGQTFTLSHGLGDVSFTQHHDHPFTVAGILAPTGTPVDQTIHVSLASLKAVHHGGPAPDSITALLIGLESRPDAFAIQRDINNYRPEALLAIMPGVALMELWQMMSIVEQVLALIAALVLLAAMLGMTTMLLSTLQQRGREIAVLRTLGASPLFLFALIQTEALLMTLAGMVLGIATLTAAIMLGNDWISSEYGLFVTARVVGGHTLPYLISGVMLTLMLACIPATLTYRSSVALRLES